VETASHPKLPSRQIQRTVETTETPQQRPVSVRIISHHSPLTQLWDGSHQMASQQSPKPRNDSFTNGMKHSAPTSASQPNSLATVAASRPFDLDGMTVMTDVGAPVAPEANLDLNMDLEPISESLVIRSNTTSPKSSSTNVYYIKFTPQYTIIHVLARVTEDRRAQ
jgi:hypothetical protein